MEMQDQAAIVWDSPLIASAQQLLRPRESEKGTSFDSFEPSILDFSAVI
jgi:hypothetical protein